MSLQDAGMPGIQFALLPAMLAIYMTGFISLQSTIKLKKIETKKFDSYHGIAIRHKSKLRNGKTIFMYQ